MSAPLTKAEREELDMLRRANAVLKARANPRPEDIAHTVIAVNQHNIEVQDWEPLPTYVHDKPTPKAGPGRKAHSAASGDRLALVAQIVALREANAKLSR